MVELYNMQRGSAMIKILELLHNGAMTQVDFWTAVLAAGYGASSSKIEFEYQKLRRDRKNKVFREEQVRNRKLRLQKFLYKLKRDNLIKEVAVDEEVRLALSKKGEEKLAQLKNKFLRKHYSVEKKGKTTVIISFDIPEQLKRKRAWLREVIRNLGFDMIHKSVWMGKGALPRELISDIERMNILEFIEIFEVSKTGTLQKVKGE